LIRPLAIVAVLERAHQGGAPGQIIRRTGLGRGLDLNRGTIKARRAEKRRR
jgi:hypothetical protein